MGCGFESRPIHHPFHMSYEEYSRALKRIILLRDTIEPGSKEEAAELEALMTRVEAYEERLYPLVRVVS